ncbi:MAG TPA: AAA family ATPase, partial [Candidatus Kapabacteria bacterium]
MPRPSRKRTPEPELIPPDELPNDQHTLGSQFAPLAERMRPRTLDDVVGQSSLIGPGKPLRVMIERGKLHSMVFWGPPGSGKTTLANILARSVDAPFFSLSAISAGVKDLREAIESATQANRHSKDRSVLFIDEVHRFSKSQQDALLAAVEHGVITLIGATTENPSFEVISPLLSRARVFVLENLSREDLELLLDRALTQDSELSPLQISLTDEARRALIALSGGDARKMLNAVELAVQLIPPPFQDQAKTPPPFEDQAKTPPPFQDQVKTPPPFEDRAKTPPPFEDQVKTPPPFQGGGRGVVPLPIDAIEAAYGRKASRYDKGGEEHYNIISAFIKSMRGSDPNAALYWCARMIESGEDLEFIARRMIIFASEDIGNADPNALLLANACWDAVRAVGYPEATI